MRYGTTTKEIKKIEGTTKTMYFYNRQHPKDPENMDIMEVPVQMYIQAVTVKDRLGKTVEYYEEYTPVEDYKKTIPVHIIIPKIPTKDVGKLFNGVLMILDRADINFYRDALIQLYKRKIEDAKKSLERFENYINKIEQDKANSQK